MEINRENDKSEEISDVESEDENISTRKNRQALLLDSDSEDERLSKKLLVTADTHNEIHQIETDQRISIVEQLKNSKVIDSESENEDVQVDSREIPLQVNAVDMQENLENDVGVKKPVICLGVTQNPNLSMCFSDNIERSRRTKEGDSFRLSASHKAILRFSSLSQAQAKVHTRVLKKKDSHLFGTTRRRPKTTSY